MMTKKEILQDLREQRGRSNAEDFNKGKSLEAESCIEAGDLTAAAEALQEAFLWRASIKGHEHWCDVYNALIDGHVES